MKNLGASVALAAVLLLAIFAMGALLLLPLKAHAEPSRLYPYTGLRYRMQDGEAPKVRAEFGVACSLGRFAPSLTASAGLDSKWSPGLDVGLRFKL